MEHKPQTGIGWNGMEYILPDANAEADATLPLPGITKKRRDVGWAPGIRKFKNILINYYH